jgi:hypothetical protein
MLALAASSWRVISCFSARVTPGAGRGMRAEAPPEMQQMTRSSAVAAAARAASAMGGFDAALIGDGVAAFAELGVAKGDGVAVLDDHATGGDAPAADLFDGAGHGRGGLAGAEEDYAFGAAEEGIFGER